MAVSTAIRMLVRERSGMRCEYCRMKEAWEPYFIYHVEHIIALQYKGDDSPDNLALACNHCNLIKGPNLSSIDPDTNEVTRLFHPRVQDWADHFHLTGGRIAGLTPVGRTTVFLLEMNALHRIELRQENFAGWCAA
ncbi:MAG: endonuclease [Verrucomicrobiaceae bacterium]|nr:endonuclease [Verrucomicrobiaceae bacterium]